MDISHKRKEDYFLNREILDNISTVNERVARTIKNCKYLQVSTINVDLLAEKVKMLLDANIDLTDKQVIILVEKDGYLTTEQTEKLIKIREELHLAGAELKIKDGDYYEIEEISAISSQLEDVVNKIKSATVDDNGKSRPLNEMEKFLWAYSYVANRKFQKNEADLDSPRSITSIFKTGDCVCVGFATILKELCRQLNIECYMNSCQVYDKTKDKQEGHCNNVVVINGTAYYCDACWDCLAEGRRDRRTFSTCLVPFEDRKESVHTRICDLTAPFADTVSDLSDIKEKLNQIESLDNITEEQFKEYTSLEIKNRLSRYINFVPKYQYNGADIFMNRKYKDEAVYYYKEVIKLIENKQINEPLSIEDFENALVNIYKSMGNSEEKAQAKAKLDIDASCVEAGISYLPNAKNCFAKEYFKQLEI